jgi:hypothetical protein
MKETLNEKYNDMTKRLYMPMIFYFPRRIWSQFDKKKWNDKMFDNVFDKVVLIKPDGTDALLNNELSNHHFFIKRERLDKNTFKLLDLQKDLDSKQFKFILNKYCQQLDFIRRISKWMVGNIHKDINGLNKETFLSFEMQQNSFNEHWKYVKESFVDAPKIEDVTTDTFLSKKDFKSFQDLMNPSGILLSTNNKETQVEKGIIKPKRPRKEKKILVTEEEATNFLLKTVFNLEL